jgi:hypothetical protein
VAPAISRRHEWESGTFNLAKAAREVRRTGHWHTSSSSTRDHLFAQLCDPSVDRIRLRVVHFDQNTGPWDGRLRTSRRPF